jgi:alpha-mannosidase
MKKIFTFAIVLALAVCSRAVSKDLPFPTGMECKEQSFYGHRADGKAGRAVILTFTGPKLSGDATVETMGETTRFRDLKEVNQLTVLLPAGIGVSTACEARITLRQGKRSLDAAVSVPAKRQWTVYIYPHSHVDIGYTNTQRNVEEIHKRNLLHGIALAKGTAGYPDGARYLWNTEVIWPVERYLQQATPAQRAEIIDAVRKGYLCLDAGYINDNTSVAADEEFDGFFGPAKRLEKLTGVPVDTMVQVDVPGMSWGIVPAAAKAGVRYIMAFNNGGWINNGGARTGHSIDLSYHPFWWIGPDGKTKVLFLQPDSYAMGAQLKGMPLAMSMMGQTDVHELPETFQSKDPRAHFVDRYLWPTLERLEKSDFYPYDIFAMSWALADNTPIDADLPDAVKSWNAEYAYPHLVIASAHQIMSTFEKKYGDKLPTRRGDFTEYWTDGLGSAARQTAMNRASKERLIQADTLWAMLHRGRPAPRAEFDEAWRYVVLGSEHTWCFAVPERQPITDDILKVKFSYFQDAEDRSRALLAAAIGPAAASNTGAIAVFNTLNWKRSGLAVLTKEQSAIGDGVSSDNGPVPSQRLSTGELAFLAGDISAFGSRVFRLRPGITVEESWPIAKAAGNLLENSLVKVALDPKTGDIISLKDKTGYEYVDKKAACAVNSYRYLHGADRPSKATGPTDVRIAIKENGPLVASLLVESQAEGCKKLTREIRLVAGQPQVEIINVVDKLACKAKEGVHFGFAFNVPNPRTRVDIPWGVMEVDADQFSEGNRNWICFQRWLDISNGDRGVTWSSLDAPTFEHGNITANILGSGGAWIRRLQPSATIYSWALNNHWFTNFPLSQEGRLTYRFRILPHISAYDAAAANRFGMEQVRPLIATPVKQAVAVTPPVAIDNPRVVVSGIKSDAEGLVVTLRSLSDKPETVTLTRPGKPAEPGITLLPFGCTSTTLKQ